MFELKVAVARREEIIKKQDEAIRSLEVYVVLPSDLKGLCHAKFAVLRSKLGKNLN